MVNRTALVVVLISLCLVGCNMNNRCTVKDTLRELPNGDALVGTSTYVTGPFVHHPQGEPQLVWQRSGQPDRVLVTTAASGIPDYEACKTAQAHLSPDGNRAWLTRDGKVLASFDREAGAASFGDHFQPDWAKP
jgi:hypothetical protein